MYCIIIFLSPVNRQLPSIMHISHWFIHAVNQWWHYKTDPDGGAFRVIHSFMVFEDANSDKYIVKMSYFGCQYIFKTTGQCNIFQELWVLFTIRWVLLWLCTSWMTPISLEWRHNGLDSVSNHQPHDCLLNRIFRRRSKKTSKLRVTGLCEGNSPGTGEFPAQMASNSENVSIWWAFHASGSLHWNDCPVPVPANRLWGMWANVSCDKKKR